MLNCCVRLDTVRTEGITFGKVALFKQHDKAVSCEYINMYREQAEIGHSRSIHPLLHACLTHCSGADVRPFQAGQATLGDLCRHLVRYASSEDCHLVVYKLLGQFSISVADGSKFCTLL
ncbi:hypothetical protein E2562_001115 [Oryza meyeriana var. granulata]|uniref:Uncharacterized protein n=1 Tax=Oryza meyeriana var. granulata TaxID=110450 RepID=A0A6G1EFK3_9ORYZ|nr:hypothetical protein E2562_001115 [Oryza meyeriana var. granulata]